MSRALAVGRLVHYVAPGSADGTHPCVCRPAMVVEHDGRHAATLMVINPTGVHFRADVVLSLGMVSDGDHKGFARCAGGTAFPGLTWHWPEEPARSMSLVGRTVTVEFEPGSLWAAPLMPEASPEAHAWDLGDRTVTVEMGTGWKTARRHPEGQASPDLQIIDDLPAKPRPDLYSTLSVGEPAKPARPEHTFNPERLDLNQESPGCDDCEDGSVDSAQGLDPDQKATILQEDVSPAVASTYLRTFPTGALAEVLAERGYSVMPNPSGPELRERG